MKKLLTFAFLLFFCTPTFSQTWNFSTYDAFKDTLNRITAISDPTIRNSTVTAFINSLKSKQQIPFRIGNQVAFIYRGNFSSVKWNGDFNSWGGSNSPNMNGVKLFVSDVWINEQTFPSTARLDYKIVTNGSNWILDPNNTFKQLSGVGGYNSELRMPDYVYSEFTIEKTGITKGSLSNNILMNSTNLSYSVNYRVYTPYNYMNLDSLPVIFITDGHEYAHKELGAATVILDNLIYEQKIEPIIAVFMDPRNPSNTSTNRRMTEYNLNDNFLNFVVNELIPKIDTDYKTNPKAEHRAILGTSMGGLNSAFFGGKRPDIFGKIAIQSPAFSQNLSVYNYWNGSDLSVNVFLSFGNIFDGTNQALNFKNNYLNAQDYIHTSIIVEEGHSWGQWRALLDDMLIYYWPKKSSSFVNDKSINTEYFQIEKVYPNPFNPTTTISYELQQPRNIKISVFDLLGKELVILLNESKTIGKHQVELHATNLSSGTYFVVLTDGLKTSVAPLFLIK